MSSVFDNNLLPKFDSIKDSDEEILWTGKPKFIPFLATGLPYLGVGILWFCFDYFGFIRNGFINDFGLATLFFLFHLFPFWGSILNILRLALVYNNTCYAYSNKRVMMRTGFIGTDFKIIDYDKISDIEVTVNVIERIYNVGTIRFFSGRTQTNKGNTTKLYDKWIAIETPYEIFKKVKQVSVDIKTDFNYPNALRPETNPGYKTKYDRKNDY